jgi:hypothetical protein
MINFFRFLNINFVGLEGLVFEEKIVEERIVERNTCFDFFSLKTQLERNKKCQIYKKPFKPTQ